MERLVRGVVGLAFLVVSCSQTGSPGVSETTSSSSVSPSSAAPADPLVGVWRQDFSCEDNVRTFRRLINVDYGYPLYAKWVRSDMSWGPHSETATELTPEALCEGAPDRHRVMKIEDGVIVFFEDWGPPSNPATYELLDDHTFTASDGGIDMTLEATYRFTFEIDGDQLTIALHRDPLDPWVGVPYGVAPFYRVSS